MYITLIHPHPNILESAKQYNFDMIACNISNYKPLGRGQTFYVISINSLGSLNDKNYKNMFPQIEKESIKLIKKYGKVNLLSKNL